MCIYTLVMQTNTYTTTVSLSGLIERNLSQSTSSSPTHSELRWDAVSLLSPLSHCAHVCEVSPHHQSVLICISSSEQQVCHIYSMCWFFICLFFFFFLSLYTPALCRRGLCDEERANWKISLPPLSFSPPGTLSSLYLLPILLVSHLSSHSAPLLSPSSSDFPSDLSLSLSQRAHSQPGNCMSTGHHTCCCQCGRVGERAELHPLASVALTPSPPPLLRM